MTEKKRVMHIVPDVIKGGVSEALYQIIKRSKKNNPEIEHVIMTYSEQGSDPFYQHKLEELGVKVHRVAPDRGIADPQNQDDVQQQVANILEQQPELQSDAVMAWMQRSQVVGNAFADQMGSAKIRVMNNARRVKDMKPKQINITQYAAETSQEADVIIAVSDYIKDLALDEYGYSVDANIRVIDEGVDTDLFKTDPEARNRIREEFGIPKDAPVIGNIARLHPMKDPRGFLMACAELKKIKPESHFILIGDGFDPANDCRDDKGRPDTILALYLDEIRDEMGVDLRDGSLHLAGHRADVYDVVNAMDVMASTSQSEGFGRSLIEAKAVGIPSVVTHVSQMPKIAGKNGRTIPPRDISVDTQLIFAGKKEAKALRAINGSWARYAAKIYAEQLSLPPEKKQEIQQEEVAEAKALYDLDIMAGNYMQAVHDGCALRQEKSSVVPLSSIQRADENTATPLEAPELVLFDWDDTLVESETYTEACHQRTFDILREQGLGAPEYFAAADRGDVSFDDYFLRLKETYGWSDDTHALALKTIQEQFATQPYEPQLIEGARETLRNLKQRGVPFAIISNVPDFVLQEKVPALLGDEFPELKAFGSKPNAPKKPDPSYYHHVLESLGVEPGKHVLHVGDGLQNDALAASDAGLSTILFGRNSSQVLPLAASLNLRDTRVKDLVAAENHEDLRSKIRAPEIARDRAFA